MPWLLFTSPIFLKLFFGVILCVGIGMGFFTSPHVGFIFIFYAQLF